MDEQPLVGPNPTSQEQSSYGKRKLLKWGLVYFAIALAIPTIAFGIFYASFILEKVLSSSPYSPPPPAPVTQPTPTPTNETANWKTYTDIAFGYSIKYPVNWEVVVREPIEPDTKQEVVFQEKEFKLWQANLTVKIFSNNKGRTLEQWAQNYKEPNAADPANNLASLVGDTTLDGKPAKRFSIFTFEVPNDSAIISIYKQNVYYIRFDDWGKYKDTNIAVEYGAEHHQKIYDQILSTLRFLDQSDSNYKTTVASICENVLKEPTDPLKGISFPQSYCQGDQCRNAKLKDTCESIDVIKIENGRITSGKDGKVDCEWTSTVETMYFCARLH